MARLGFIKLATLIAILSICYDFAVGSKPSPCRKTKDIEDFLREAGIAQKHASTYAGILKRHHIDENILPKITIPRLQKLGITAYGDCLKIEQYFSGDSDECANGSQCQNGGLCRDGFKCFDCVCTRDFFGPTCAKRCPCKNNGRCMETVTGFRCECSPGYTGILCEKQWLNEDRFKQLEERLKELNESYINTKKILEQSQKEIIKQKQILYEVQTKQNVSGWSMIRVDEDFNKLTKIQLHEKTPTYIQKMPMCLPRNTKAILISVFTNFWNSGGHAYLHFETHQQGNKRNGSVAVNNKHYNIYANTFYYELMLPWDVSLPDELVFVVKRSYNDGGSSNWYNIKLVGYITA